MTAPSIAAVSAEHAAQRGGDPAIACEDRVVSFQELEHRSNRAAHALRAAGMVPGDRVVHLGRDSEHYYELLLACAKAGTVLVPVDSRLTAPEVAHILADSGARLVFVERDSLAAIPGVPAPGIQNVIVFERGSGLRDWTAGEVVADPLPTADPEAPLIQLYTSGTTGAPKGVVLSQGSFWAVYDLLEEHALDWLDWQPGDRSLNVLPGHHIGGPWWFLQGFRAGGLNLLAPGFTADNALELIRREKVSTTLLVPSMIDLLLSERGATPEDFSSLRKVVYGGSPMPGSLLRRALDTMGCEFAQIYGLTETCASAVCLPPADHDPSSPRAAAVGRPYPGVRLRVVDRAGVNVPTGQVGEVLIDTPARMAGYWGRPAATAAALAGGWLHTGDAGHLDEDGYLFLHDRIKDVIITAGENVYPAEVENALTEHSAVAQAAVVGRPHPRWGETVQAFVVLRPGKRVTARELLAFLRDKLAGYKRPADFEFVETLPHNAAGKVLRRVLRDSPPGSTVEAAVGSAVDPAVESAIESAPELPDPATERHVPPQRGDGTAS
ncbi:MAG: long-chain-fatty-acid--CoA ligase [Catenulispora sp.]|nr:long-chain-fatty-acid--CoA ligase [Catenulispora sp.]